MSTAQHQGIDRRAFVRQLVEAFPQALVVTGLGSSSYDLYAAGDRDENFYLWGAMGGAAAVGLGIAIAQPTRTVIVVTGDGEQLMGIGALATIGSQQPANLNVVVLDNGHFGETGMQRSHTSLGTDLATVAAGCGIGQTVRVSSTDEAGALFQKIAAATGPLLATVKVLPDELPRALPPRDGVYVKNRFRAVLGLAPM